MTIDIHTEELLTLAEAAGRLPRLRRGKKVHVSTLYRWIKRGVRGVRLEAVRLGRTLVTSAEALQRFVERLSEPAEVEPVRVPNRVLAADRELERRGL